MTTRQRNFFFSRFVFFSPIPFFVLQVFKAGLYGARYAWLIPGWFGKNWWKIRLKNESIACTEEQMNKAIKGYIACDNLKISPDNAVTVSGQVTKSILDTLIDNRGVRSFSSCSLPLFQNEPSCQTFHMKINQICICEPVGGAHFYFDSFSRNGSSENRLLHKSRDSSAAPLRTSKRFSSHLMLVIQHSIFF